MSLREAHKDRTRASLVDAAFGVLEERGIEQLTAESVAERAGVSRRTLFNYFGTVEETLLVPAHASMDTLVAEIERSEASVPPLDVLRRALPTVFDATVFDRIASIRRAAVHSPALRRAETAIVTDSVGDALALLEARSRRVGVEPDRLFLAGLARSGLGAIETAAEAWMERTGGAADEESRRTFTELAQRALDDLRSGYGSADTPDSPDTTTEGRP